MGAAAGAAVRSGEGHDADVPLQGLFAAVVDGVQLRTPVGLDIDGVVLIDILIGLGFDFQQFLPGDVGVEIDGHHIRPHVETYIVAVAAAADQPGADVLAGVLLHVVEPPGPVDDAGDSFPNFHGAVHIVENYPVFFMDVRHRRAVQGALVGGLAAPLRVEGGAVQCDNEAVFSGLAVQHRGGEGL